MGAKTIAIVQSNYIPWKGYFDLIRSVDEFILFDDMQYTRRDWRNRNAIQTPGGVSWLTIPVESKGKYFQRICDTVVASQGWAADHWKSITHFLFQGALFRNVPGAARRTLPRGGNEVPERDQSPLRDGAMRHAGDYDSNYMVHGL